MASSAEGVYLSSSEQIILYLFLMNSVAINARCEKFKFGQYKYEISGLEGISANSFGELSSTKQFTFKSLQYRIDRLSSSGRLREKMITVISDKRPVLFLLILTIGITLYYVLIPIVF
jgi:hypothetical protein